MTHKRLKALLILTILMLIAVVSGCSKSDSDDVVVAKVGNRKIMLSEINGFFERGGTRFISADAEYKVKRDFLDSLINQNLLIMGAYEHNLENNEEVNRVVEGEKVKFLLDVLFEQKITSKATPSEAEIKDWYDKLDEELKASHILVDSLDTAKLVLQKLREGVPFEELALKYSKDPSVKRNQGDLGWFSWGLMVDNFQDAVFKMQPGEISAPVKTDYGYHIIKLVDRRKLENRLSYAESKENIRQQIMDRRKRQLMFKFRDELKAKYPVTVEKPTCQFVLNKLDMLYPPKIGNTPRWRNNIDPSQLDQAEKDLVLGHYDGGKITLGQYLTNLRRVPPDDRPDFDDYNKLADVLFQMAFYDILGIEAKKMGLENNEDYKEKVRTFRERAMADVFRYDSIPSIADVNEGELQEYYDTHHDEFTKPLRFHLLEILVDDKARAQKIVSTVRSEDRFRSMAAAETQRPGKRVVEGDLGIVLKDQYPDLYAAAEKTPVGKLAGPIPNSGKFSVIYVKERREPELQDFDNVRMFIVDKLTKMKGDKLYEQWIADKKKDVDIEVYEDRLKNSIDAAKYASMPATDSTTTVDSTASEPMPGS